jgi:Transposase DDE domain
MKATFARSSIRIASAPLSLALPVSAAAALAKSSVTIACKNQTRKARGLSGADKFVAYLLFVNATRARFLDCASVPSAEVGPIFLRARELVNTSEFANAQRERKKVEALFAELKNQIGLRRLRLRRLKFVREQFFLAAAAQNIKRLVRFLSQGQRPPVPVTS